jgi:vacuolar-type H+-ATPase subunit H
MERLIDELEALIQRGRRVPGSGKILVDEAAAVNLLERMREYQTGDAASAQRVTGERDRILADARLQARRIIEEAQTQVHGKLDDQYTVQAARQRAKEIQVEAEQRASSLRAETDAYVINQLNGLENRIQRLLREVQAGQRALAQEHAKRADSGPAT